MLSEGDEGAASAPSMMPKLTVDENLIGDLLEAERKKENLKIFQAVQLEAERRLKEYKKEGIVNSITKGPATQRLVAERMARGSGRMDWENMPAKYPRCRISRAMTDIYGSPRRREFPVLVFLYQDLNDLFAAQYGLKGEQARSAGNNFVLCDPETHKDISRDIDMEHHFKNMTWKDLKNSASEDISTGIKYMIHYIIEMSKPELQRYFFGAARRKLGDERYHDYGLTFGQVMENAFYDFEIVDAHPIINHEHVAHVRKRKGDPWLSFGETKYIEAIVRSDTLLSKAQLTPPYGTVAWRRRYPRNPSMFYNNHLAFGGDHHFRELRPRLDLPALLSSPHFFHCMKENENMLREIPGLAAFETPNVEEWIEGHQDGLAKAEEIENSVFKTLSGGLRAALPVGETIDTLNNVEGINLDPKEIANMAGRKLLLCPTLDVKKVADKFVEVSYRELERQAKHAKIQAKKQIRRAEKKSRRAEKKSRRDAKYLKAFPEGDL